MRVCTVWMSMVSLVVGGCAVVPVSTLGSAASVWLGGHKLEAHTC